MLKRSATVTGIATVLLIVGAVPAFAADPWSDVDCGQTPSPGCDIGVGTGGGSGNPKPGQDNAPSQHDDGRPASTGGDESLAACDYRPSDYRPPGAVGSGVMPGTWMDGVCSASGVIQTPEFVAALTPAEVARLARAQLRLPAPAIAANPSSEQLVTLPTWLWLSSGWQQQSATASVPGVSVTAVARPTSLVWSMGDGAVVTCSSAGSPFPAGADPRSASPDCGHTYRSSSAGQPNDAYPVTATVHWSITWSGAGQSGTFPDMTTTATVAFRVVESQAINTG
jgi:hypothetical protein